MTNNTGTKCIQCGEGHYKVFDLNDDIFGDLHCDNCRHHVKFNQDLGKCPFSKAQMVLDAYKEATELSPASQAVLDAINKELDEAPWDLTFIAGSAAAAALRAAADQVVPHEATAPWNELKCDYDGDHWEMRQWVRDQLLAIAIELEAQ